MDRYLDIVLMFLSLCRLFFESNSHFFCLLPSALLSATLPLKTRWFQLARLLLLSVLLSSAFNLHSVVSLHVSSSTFPLKKNKLEFILPSRLSRAPVCLPKYSICRARWTTAVGEFVLYFTPPSSSPVPPPAPLKLFSIPSK